MAGLRSTPFVRETAYENTLAVLVLFREGRNRARPELLRIMWPDATRPSALRTTSIRYGADFVELLVPKHDEDCPYLVRHRAQAS